MAPCRHAPGAAGGAADQADGAVAAIDCGEYMNQLEFDVVGVTRTRADHGVAANENWHRDHRTKRHRAESPSARNPGADRRDATRRAHSKATTSSSTTVSNESQQRARLIDGGTNGERLSSYRDPVDRLDRVVTGSTLYRPADTSRDSGPGPAFEPTIGGSDATHPVGNGEPGFGVVESSGDCPRHNVLNRDRSPASDPIKGLRLWSFSIKPLERERVTDTVGVDADLGGCLDQGLTRHTTGSFIFNEIMLSGDLVCAAQHTACCVGVELFGHPFIVGRDPMQR